jgi:hypothetical protein
MFGYGLRPSHELPTVLVQEVLKLALGEQVVEKLLHEGSDGSVNQVVERVAERRLAEGVALTDPATGGRILLDFPDKLGPDHLNDLRFKLRHHVSLHFAGNLLTFDPLPLGASFGHILDASFGALFDHVLAKYTVVMASMFLVGICIDVGARRHEHHGSSS